MSDESTPRSSGKLEFHDFLLREMRAGMNDIRAEVRDSREEVRGYRNEASAAITRLDEHIRSCDRRYAVIASAGPSAQNATGVFTKPWVLKKLSERLIDYGVFALIALVIFAFQHGAHFPVPSP